MDRLVPLLTVTAFTLNLLWASRSLSEPPTAVPSQNPIDQLLIRGAEQVAPDAIRAALGRDHQTMKASLPGASLADLIELLPQRVQAGYINGGFLDAEVTAEWDAEQARLQLLVDEGSQRKWRELRIEGVDPETEAALRSALTTEAPETDDSSSTSPGWTAGRPANGHEAYANRIRTSCEQALADLGWEEPQLTVRVDPIENDQADLIIEVQDPGRRVPYSRIHVRGNKRQPTEAILDILAVTPGQILTAAQRQAAADRLLETGRFLSVRVETEARLFPDEPKSLLVLLDEWEDAPLLGDELDELQKIALKRVEWANHFQEGEHDLEVRFQPSVPDLVSTPVDVRAIYSPKNGLAITVSGEDPLRGGKETICLLVGAERATIALLESGVAYRFPVEAFPRLIPTLNLSAVRDAETNEPRCNLKMAIGFKTRTKSSHLPAIELNLKVDPVYSLLNLAKGGDDAVFEDGILTVQSKNFRTRIDAGTGRLIEEQLPLPWGPATAKTVPHVVQGLQQSIADRCETIDIGRDGYETGIKESLLAVIQSREWKSLEQQQLALGLVESISQAMIGAEDAIREGSSFAKFGFLIPSETPSEAALANLGLLVGFINELVLTSGSALSNSLKQMHIGFTMKDPDVLYQSLLFLRAPDAGPLSYLLFTNMVRWFKPRIAGEMASYGHFINTRPRFQRELKSFFDSDRISGRLLASFSKGVRDLTRRSREAVLLLIAGDEHGPKLMATSQDASVSDLDWGRMLLVGWYEHRGQAFLQQQLDAIAGPPKNPSLSTIQQTAGEKAAKPKKTSQRAFQLDPDDSPWKPNVHQFDK